MTARQGKWIRRGPPSTGRSGAGPTPSSDQPDRRAAPPGLAVEPAAEGVRLSGRGLKRRFALEPALRWLTAVLR
jgi:hypothetical protein